ncbi:MAG: hypothetical protein NHG36_17115 [Chromatiaceae bacterium]|jgi:predicted house-cleaning noncanonical NTP pyrophosphatase (MazG superfamily)|nr:hypothetical protein [Candidatus Thioaporhodococcus sediminis]
MTDIDLADFDILELKEILEDVFFLPDIHIDELADMMELVDNLIQISTTWPCC